jgi:hypothetical protein
MNFQIGDNIYRIIGKTIDTNNNYIIKDIIKDDSYGSWHDSYAIEYSALVKNILLEKEEKILLYYGSSINNIYEVYAIKVIDYNNRIC